MAEGSRDSLKASLSEESYQVVPSFLGWQVVQEYITFLHGLATLSKDCAVLMCCLGTEKTLTKVLEKHSSGLRLVTELRDLIRDCENYANLYKKLTTSILAGCIQVNLWWEQNHLHIGGDRKGSLDN